MRSVKTKVIISIDTEFSIGGAFDDPANNMPVGAQTVLCEVAGRSHGLGYLLDTFATFGTKATFFVEAFNSYYFGDRPMRDLAMRIMDAGHDVQLHLHPCWTYFRNPDWTERLQSDPPTDHMDGRSVAQLTAWLADGVAIFERWGIGRPGALRTGSMIVDRSVYQAMERVGIRYSSNVALGLYRPADAGLHFYSGIHRVEGVTEICVLTYIDAAIGRRAHYRALTITGASWQETRTLLLRAREADVESVVILTHPFEYVKYDRQDFSGLVPNRINQRRLALLCEFLRDHDDRYEVATLGDLASRPPPPPSPANVILKVPPHCVVGRIVQNGLNSRIRRL
jgi:peptidoglycan/xylan/chitin deacetylase (PgdA/CDA1 family)